MKRIIIALTFVFITGCQNQSSDELSQLKAEAKLLSHQVEVLKQQIAKDQKKYAELESGLEQLSLDAIDYEEDYKKGQQIIEQQDARYNALLDRWEQQAARMDAILSAQEKALSIKP